MEASRIRKGMVVECQQGVGTILVVDHEAETYCCPNKGLNSSSPLALMK